MTHDELVKYGRKWMSKRSPIVITEITTAISESPDIIAFDSSWNFSYGTVLIEVKVSRQDFKRDFKKWFRLNSERGIGDYRYYLTPKGLIKIEELPEKWGLLESSEKGRISIIKKAEQMESNKRNEIQILTSTLKRLNIQDNGHTSIRVYRYETKNKTTLTIKEELLKEIGIKFE